ncbi:hypothetical protein Hanom_Chr09g00865791 [Helianthus anomalus]
MMDVILRQSYMGHLGLHDPYWSLKINSVFCLYKRQRETQRTLFLLLFFLSFIKQFHHILVRPQLRFWRIVQQQYEDEGSDVPDSYDGRVNDDHVEEVVSNFRSYHKEPLFCLAVITVTGVRVMKTDMMPRTDQKTMATIFSLMMPYTYNKTLVSFLTPKSHSLTSNPFTRNSHWLTSNPLTRKFRTKQIMYECYIYFVIILL